MDSIKVPMIYRHFKGNLYYVEGLATCSETGKTVVIYRALYGDYKLYIRDLSDFMSEIDKNRSDNSTGQSHRFELVVLNKLSEYVK